MNQVDLSAAVDAILRGSFDLHVHAGPDRRRPRRVDALDAARHAQEAEMGGFVLKSHDYPTAPLAYALCRMYPGLRVVGSITLNPEVGGLNPQAVEAAEALGARVVWMPTHGAAGGTGPGISVLAADGRLDARALDILDIVVAKGMVLASGHLPPVEALALFAEARARGVERLVATHPGGSATVEEQQAMASCGAFIEHTFLSCMPSSAGLRPAELVAAIRRVGVDRSVVTTDFGQWLNPPPAEGMRMAIATLLDAGMEPEEVATLVRKTPAQLLGLDARAGRPGYPAGPSQAALGHADAARP